MNNREEAKKRTQLLKELRTKHSETVARTQTLLKQQKRVHQEICKLIRTESKTVPEIAEAIDLPTKEILWHITALKKYDIVVEDGMCGEYFLYRRAED